MTDEKLQNLLTSLFNSGDIGEDFDDELDFITEARTFQTAEILTHNKGLVISLSDGSEFQLTIVKSG